MASIAPSSSSTQTVNYENKNYTVPLITLTTLFFMWGAITCMNDLLIPYFKDILNLTHAQAGLVQSAFFGAYFVVSLIYFIISSNFGDPLARIGYKNGIIIGLITGAVGCALFYPAAEALSYPVFLFALFVLAGGITILQMAANPYVALLGHPDTASSRLILSQALNSFGTTIAPIIGGKLIFDAVAGQQQVTAEAVKTPYLFLAGTLLVIAVVIWLSKLPDFSGEKVEKGLGVLRYSHLVLGVVAIFMYVGGEVTIGSWLIDYCKEMFGWTDGVAATYVAYYWGGAMVGRFNGAVYLGDYALSKKAVLMTLIAVVAVGTIYAVTRDMTITLTVFGLVVGNTVAFILGKSRPAGTLALFALIVVGLLAVNGVTSGQVALWALLGIGLFNSIMFPTIFTLAIRDLGKLTGQGSSLLVMAIVGGAILPPLAGLIASSIGFHKMMLFAIIPYLYIFYYGIRGAKVKQVAS